MSNRTKLDKLLNMVRQAVENGTYRITSYALQRMEDRDITLPEVSYILKFGYHEASKDEFDTNRCAWRYAIRGNTNDGRDIRIVVSFDNISKMFVITVIDKGN